MHTAKIKLGLNLSTLVGAKEQWPFLEQYFELVECSHFATEELPFVLCIDPVGCWLDICEGRDHFRITVDFTEGSSRHRRLYGGGSGQAIARAVGLKKYPKSRVLDLTAGMGGDAFVLASLGCEITLVERHPLVSLLLSDGLYRARQSTDVELVEIMSRMSHVFSSAQDCLVKPGYFDVVYIDPMFPERKKKSAQVKKEMRVFHTLVGSDLDADLLLQPALACALRRVVVKRPKIAPYLDSLKPDLELLGDSTRFDVYLKK